MPKYTSEQESFQALVNTLFNGQYRTELKNGNLYVYASEADADNIINKFIKPQELRTEVLHAVKVSNKGSDNSIDKLTSITPLVLGRNFMSSSEGLEYFLKTDDVGSFAEKWGVESKDLEIISHDPVKKLISVSLRTSDTKDHIMKQTLIETLQHKILDEFRIPEDLAESRNAEYLDSYKPLEGVVKIDESNPKDGIYLSINYGKIELANERCYGFQSPVVAYDSDAKALVFNSECLLRFSNKLFNSLVCNPEVQNGVQKECTAIMMNPEQLFSDKAAQDSKLQKTTIIIDKSGSMISRIEGVKKAASEISDLLIKNASAWEIEIVVFDSVIERQTFNSQNNKFLDVDSFIKKIRLGDSTNLFEPLYNSIVSFSNGIDSSNLLLVFSDGEDTDKKKTIDQLKDASKNVSDSKVDIVFYGISLDTHVPSLKNIVETSGGTYVQKDSREGYDDFYSRITKSAHKPSLKFVFEKFFNLVDLKLSEADQKIEVGSKVKINGDEYTVGKATELKLDVVSKNKGPFHELYTMVRNFFCGEPTEEGKCKAQANDEFEAFYNKYLVKDSAYDARHNIGLPSVELNQFCAENYKSYPGPLGHWSTSFIDG